MKISVVVPVYNVDPALLTACVRSLNLQTLRSAEYEVLLIDDCSDSPDTLSILDPSALPANFQIIRHETNKGLNEARRTGVKHASADYVVFVDGDDMLTRDGLELFRMEAHRTNADVVTSWFKRWHVGSKTLSDLAILRKDFSNDVNERMAAVFRCDHSYTMCGRMFRKSLLESDVFDMPERVYHEDLVTLPRILFKARIVAAVHKTVYYYTENEASITSNFSMKHAKDFFFAFSDWQRLASQLGDSSRFSDAIVEGVEKLASTMTRRCLEAENLTRVEKDRTLEYIKSKLLSHEIHPETARYTVTKAVFRLLELRDHLSEEDYTARWNEVFEELDRQRELSKSPSARVKPKAISDMALRLKDKIVLVGQVDYQVKSAAMAARELRKRGHACVVLDNSEFVADGKRKFSLNDRSVFWRTEHIKVHKAPYGLDWLSTAKAVITFNDFNDDFRDALEFRQLLGMPTICAVEGINDFSRIDFRMGGENPYRFLPYRRCDTVFLAGKNDQRFFKDRDTRIVGLPIVEELRSKKPKFPTKPIAALNLNFTYGVLEDKRDEFLSAALEGIKRAGFDYEITQHPMDKADLSEFKVTSKTQYELIDATSVFVSRFATGILEALASGKPAIYFNPHGEQVDKYSHPLGAFEVANSPEELAKALQNVQNDIEAGVDFRKRAKRFLSEHTNFKLRGRSVEDQFADAVVDVIEKRSHASSMMHEFFFDRLEKDAPFESESSLQVFGDFQREHKAQLNDEEMLARYFGDESSVMIDVGANFGNSCDVYLGKGWTVHAFEPDPYNRSKLQEVWPHEKRLIINEEAVDDKGGQELSFYASEESTGISGLSAFTEGHKEICKVQTTTLRDYYKKAGLTHVDFLKVDVEGFDKFVLEGFPWESDRPEIVLAEFEDNKTVPLGYTIHDLAKLMEAQGYTVYVSEWHPIVKYGVSHDWRRFLKYDADLDLSKTWGNLIGFKDDPGMGRLRELIRDTLKFSVPVNQPRQGAETNKNTPLKASAAQATRLERPFYAEFGDKLRKNSPRVFSALQMMRRLVFGVWRRKYFTLPIIGIAISVLFLSSYSPFDVLRSSHLLLAGMLALAVGVTYLAAVSYMSFRKLYADLEAQKTILANATDLSRRTDKIQQTQFAAEIAQTDLEHEVIRMKAALADANDRLDELLISSSEMRRALETELRSHGDILPHPVPTKSKGANGK